MRGRDGLLLLTGIYLAVTICSSYCFSPIDLSSQLAIMEEFVMSGRPTGVTVIALFFMLVGIFSLVWSLIIFGVGGVTSAFTGLFGAENLNVAASSGMWAGFLGILAAIVQIAAGIGLLRMKTWSWYVAVAAVSLSVLQGLVGLFGGSSFALLCGLIWLSIPVIVLIYLARGSMRKRFGITF
jgi:hypothetical protein